MEDRKVKRGDGWYQLNLTWEQLEEQRLANEQKNTKSVKKIRKYV